MFCTMQERMDNKNSRTKEDARNAKRFRDRLILRLQVRIWDKSAEVLALSVS